MDTRREEGKKKAGLAFGMVIILLLTLLFYSLTVIAQQEAALGKDLDNPYDYLRFHVLAHSNRPQDQEIKTQLAVYLLSQLSYCRQDNLTREEVIKLLEDKTNELEELGEEFMLAKGYNLPVKVVVEEKAFPPRIYNERYLPPGEYQALKVVIGDGVGENWWCLLFPPLCFAPFIVDEESKTEKTSDTKDKDEEASFPPSPRFFVLELLEKIYIFIVNKIS